MKRATISIAVAIASLALASASLLIASPLSQEARPAVVEYADSPEGLQHFLQDLFGAIKHKDKPKANSLWESMTLPNHAAWFEQVFGEEDGPRLDERYVADSAESASGPSKFYQSLARSKDMQIKITRLKDAESSSSDPWAKPLITSTKVPVSAYAASVTGSDSKFGASLGYFFFADGGFRQMDRLLFGSLPAMKSVPQRIRVGGNVVVSQLVSAPPPEYPSNARKNHVQGAVILHVIIGTGGIVEEVTVISGDPELAQAAADAVRQWRYRPTTLKGVPVEVETTVTVNFALGG